MGSGASAGIAAAASAVSADDLKAAFSGFSAEERQKLVAALQASAEPVAAKDHLSALTGPAKQEVAAMGAMSDEQVVDFFRNSDMMKRVIARTGMTLEDIVNGHPITGKCRHPIGKKLMDGAALAITVGCDAPDGPVFGLGETATTLHATIKENMGERQLTLLVFGSQTCPMFMGKLPGVVELARPHMEAGKLSVLAVYIREAHPTDGWSNGADSPLPKVAQTHTMPDRLGAAKAFAESAKDLLKGIPLWVDDPTTNCLDLAYEAPPARLVAIDKELKVVFATGQAPLQYDLAAVEALLRERLA